MNPARIRQLLKEIGFNPDPSNQFIETWLKKEEKLEFRAKAGHLGIVHNGLSILARHVDFLFITRNNFNRCSFIED